jgi:hypothetical protein
MNQPNKFPLQEASAPLLRLLMQNLQPRLTSTGKKLHV